MVLSLRPKSPRSGLLVALLSVIGIAAHADTPIPTDFSGHPSFTVVRVIDGDTAVLSLNGEDTTVRLIGVDTPETVHPQKPVEAYGKEASHFLENLLTGESVYLEYEPGASRLDKYGRTLAYLFRAPDGLFVNLEIVRQGYGHAYTRYPFQWMETFRTVEAKARESGKGLWGATGDSSAQYETQSASQALQGNDQQAGDETVQVFMTRTGSKYHRGSCRYLSKSKIPISLKDAKARGLGPCSVCRPPS